ncbi:hypothetical protein D9Q98_002525 [Chlorella vulgaris]|uniref:Uncharacterized protein n=1 Tax=Chlorella vulgaris TaxID=3077 RepID=A0A9D4TTE0_CHLVU|nr:hypothetical protein D9Q98_002525 [Chlorella vulgaris]
MRSCCGTILFTTLLALCQGRILLQADQSGAPDMVMMAPAPGPLPEGPLPEGSTNELCGGYCQLDMDCKCPGEVCETTFEYGVPPMGTGTFACRGIGSAYHLLMA